MSKITTYIQGHDAATLQSHQSRTAADQADYLLPYIQPHHNILDVGCGPGTITCDFAALVPSGTVTGIDYSEIVLTRAQEEATARGLTNITFRAASAFALPFADDAFDIVHCHAVLTHVPNAVDVVKEMRRVCKVSGYVAAREPDWDTCVVHPYSPDIERWKELDRELKRKEGAEPNAGRHLAEWAVAAGFEADRVKVSCNVLEYSGRERLRWWGELYAVRMGTEVGKRMVEAGLATLEEVERMAEAYREWSRRGDEGGLWTMMHVRLLAQK